MKGLFIPGVTAEMFRNGCLESIEELMAAGKIYDVDIPAFEGEKVDNMEEDLASGATVKTARKKDLYKLAQLIKLAGQDISKEPIWKHEDVSIMLGFERTDNEPDVLEVTDDSGYRSIVIGDIRGNISYDTHKRDDKLLHHGYVHLYSEQSSYKGDTEIWKYRCFPPTKEIAARLERLYNAEYCPDIFQYYEGDDENISSCVTYISEVVKKYVDKIASDERSALEIFEDSSML